MGVTYLVSTLHVYGIDTMEHDIESNWIRVGEFVMIEQEYDGMWCGELSEPITEWDYEDEQPEIE